MPNRKTTKQQPIEGNRAAGSPSPIGTEDKKVTAGQETEQDKQAGEMSPHKGNTDSAAAGATNAGENWRDDDFTDEEKAMKQEALKIMAAAVANAKRDVAGDKHKPLTLSENTTQAELDKMADDLTAAEMKPYKSAQLELTQKLAADIAAALPLAEMTKATRAAAQAMTNNPELQAMLKSAAETQKLLQNVTIANREAVADLISSVSPLMRVIEKSFEQVQKAVQLNNKIQLNTAQIIAAFVQTDTCSELEILYPDFIEWLGKIADVNKLLPRVIIESLPDMMPELRAYKENHPAASMFDLFNPYKFAAGDYDENGSPFEELQNAAAERTGKPEKELTPAQALPELSPIPNGEAISFLFKLLAGNVGQYATKPPKPNPNNHREKIKTFTDGRGNLKILREVKDTKGNTDRIEVALSQVEKYFKGRNTAFSKTFAFALQKMDAQNFPADIIFSLDEMVKLGMYKSTVGARRAVKQFFDQQRQILLTGAVKKGKRIITEQGGVLFYNYTIKNNIVTLSRNNKFNMDFLATYFAVFPAFAYSLNANAFNLCRYIFSQARQNGKKLEEKGQFNLSLDSVRDMLGLPTPDECPNRRYSDFIYKPIEKAIEEIEDAARNSPLTENQQFTITPMGTDTTKPGEWLKGYLEIGMTGELAKEAIKISKAKEKKLNAVMKEKAKIEAKRQLKAQEQKGQQEANGAPQNEAQ